MSVTKASLLSLAINLMFSSILSASNSLTATDASDDINSSEKKLSLRTKEKAPKSSWEDEFSALIAQYQNSPEVPEETNKGCRDVYQMKYKDPLSGNWVCTE